MVVVYSLYHNRLNYVFHKVVSLCVYQSFGLCPPSYNFYVKFSAKRTKM